jgi:putative membrane protein
VRARWASFAAGIALVVVAEVDPLADLSFDSLTMHLLQNVILAEWAPLLLVFGLSPEVGSRVARHIAPWFALPLWLVTYFVWHAPPIYDAALRNPDTLLHLEHVCYLAAGVAMWLPVAHGALGDGAKAVYLFAAFMLASPLGLLLALVPDAVYDYYDGHWGLSALADQQLAGVTMAAEQAVVLFALFSVYFARFMRAER